MKKTLIDIGTKKLEVCKVGNGRPVVVIETGMGSSFYDWNIIIEEIAKKATVIAYHRAGYGESSFSEETRTTKNIVDDLKELLDRLDIKDNIILVAHSFGGLCAQHFAKLYPEKLTGMVLVDSTPAEQYKIEEARENSPNILAKYPMSRLINRWSDLGEKNDNEIKKEINPQLSPKQKEFSVEIQNNILNFMINHNLYKTMVTELENMEQCGREIEGLGEFPNIPLKVLGRDEELGGKSLLDAGIPEEEARNFENVIQELMKKRAGDSTKGQFIYAKNCYHNIHLDNPELVIKAIEELII